MKIVAKIISHIFQPIYIIFYSLILMYFLVPAIFTQPARMTTPQIFISFFINTVFFPVITLLLLRGLKLIQSLELYERTDRYIPMLAIMIFYCWMAVITFKNQLPFPFQVLALSGFIVLVLSFLATILYLKSSLHMAGISSALAYWIYLHMYANADLTWLIMALVLCTGIVGSARLILKAHTLREVIAGTFIGVVGLKLSIIILGYIHGL